MEHVLQLSHTTTSTSHVMLLEVLSPQPRRPLKRKCVDDDHNIDDDDEGPPTQDTARRLLGRFPAASTGARCRSDSLSWRPNVTRLRLVSTQKRPPRPPSR